MRSIAEHDMAGSVFYLAPVDNASGKIFGKKEKFVAVRRLTGKRQRGCAVMGERTTPVSDDEKQYRTYWGQVASAVAQRMKDPTKQPQDQVAFKNQSEYKTLRSYLWHVCSEEMNN